jgi:hypothetical protein
MGTNSPTTAPKTRRKKLNTPVTYMVRLKDCVYPDGKEAVGVFELLSVTNGVATCWSPDQETIEVPLENCEEVKNRMNDE